MSRTTAFSCAVAGIACAVCPLPAFAADEEVQVWVTGTAVLPLADDLPGTFEISRRIREGDDQLLVRGNADYRISEKLSLGGGVAFVDSIDGLFEAGNDDEIRLQQQVNLTFGELSFRTRFEERFFDAEDRMQLRIRQRVQFSRPINKGWKGAVSGELYYIARSETVGGDEGIAQWRVNAAISHELMSHFDATVGYMIIYTPADGRADNISHVPQLTITYRP